MIYKTIQVKDIKLAIDCLTGDAWKGLTIDRDNLNNGKVIICCWGVGGVRPLIKDVDASEAEYFCKQANKIKQGNNSYGALENLLRGHGIKLKSEILANKEQISDDFLQLYEELMVHNNTTWRSVPCLKLPMDLISYQEIIHNIDANLVIEFGSYYGGSTLYFSDILRNMGGNRKVLTIDHAPGNIAAIVRMQDNIEIMQSSTLAPAVPERINQLRAIYPGKVFCILDSSHNKDHVLAEMELLRPVLKTGDYLIVEDSILGQKAFAQWKGDSPYDAREAYFEKYPDDYSYDTERENKFLITYSTKGFLIRK